MIGMDTAPDRESRLMISSRNVYRAVLLAHYRHRQPWWRRFLGPRWWRFD